MWWSGPQSDANFVLVLSMSGCRTSCGKDVVFGWVWEHSTPALPQEQSPCLCWLMAPRDSHQNTMLGFISGRCFPEAWGMFILQIWLALACLYTLAELQMETSWWNTLTGKASSSGLTWLFQNIKIHNHPRACGIQQIISRVKMSKKALWTLQTNYQT